MYQATYVSGKLVGEMSAWDASAAGYSANPAWRAGPQIVYAGRKVFTWSGTAGATFPTTSQVTALNRTNGIAPVTGTLNANYIKGDWGQERRMGGTLRNRESLLGDIVNSSPMYSADTRTLYVGANDGMLHAFNALTGAELFAYVPAGVDFAALSTLSDPQYSHKYFVDGPVVVSSYKQTPARNILVGTLGRGGKGAYALDVTSPAAFTAGNVLWELREDGGDMGRVLGEPVIVTLNDAARTKAVLMPNGLNSTNGNAVLFVVNLLTGAVIRKIDTGVGGDNGLFDPRGRDANLDGTVDYVYAGDRNGNVWKFDLSGDTVASWGLGAGGQPLYRTRTGQSITSGMAIARNAADGKAWVFFGTGSYLTLADTQDNAIQTLYGIVDDNTTVVEADLKSRDILGLRVVNGTTYRAFEKPAALPAGKKGWFLDWDNPTPGERIVVRPPKRGAAQRKSQPLKSRHCLVSRMTSSA